MNSKGKKSPSPSSDDSVSSGFLTHSTLDESQANKKTPTPVKKQKKPKQTARKSTGPPASPQKKTPKKKTLPIPSKQPRRGWGGSSS